MRSAGALAIALLLAGCGDVRTFYCFHCGESAQYSGAGDAPCRRCDRSNVAAQCPACGTVEPQPRYGPVRCAACGLDYHASKCRACSTVTFARAPGAPCPGCARAADPAAKGGAAALKKSAQDHAARKDWEPAIADAEAALKLDPADAHGRYAFACILCRAGRHERALDELEAAVRGGFANWDLLRKDGDLEALRGHPRYRVLLDRAPK